MRSLCLFLTIIALLCAVQGVCIAQDSSNQNVAKISSRYLDKVSRQTTALSNRIDKKSEKLLQKLQRQEAKLKRMLSTVDSLGAESLFADAQQKYGQLTSQLTTKTPAIGGKLTGEYLPYFDSLKGSLSFLKSNENVLSSANSGKLNEALTNVSQFQDKLQQADVIKDFIKERKQQLSDIFSRYTSLPSGITKTLNNYKSQVYYYSQQVREYKETFRDPGKLQQTALALLNKLPAFQQFMKEHSQLSGLFSLPDNYGNPEGLAGLQTKDQVQQILGGQLGGSGTNAGQVLSQQIQTAQSQLDQFKQKLGALGAGSGDVDMPDFKPQGQHTKTFLQRLEYGTNMQSTKSNYFFPTTTDIGLSVGYRMDDKKIVGVGMSYKVGWGKDIRHIALTSQGIGLRSFLDIKIKKSFYASGGLEYNYQKPFQEVQQLDRMDEWQQSGLLGITKIISVKSSVFKNTKLQLLWDFLSYQQVPRTQPIIFRVGYAWH